VNARRHGLDMTFADRNPAGSGFYATEHLSEMTKRDDVSITTITAGRRGFPQTMRWLTAGAAQLAPLRALYLSGPEVWDAFWAMAA